ncbi:class I SAM-dependent methyltransferase [uncultured Desulfuromonas sp.]|uniref:class I SAM-dependent methyltransferase n=2 Tax=Desulfuromonas TaxID=890 RepID=UPI0026366DF4|nr:class I SAM-dependent methyltransferase [uncultured Desulfuromonas sp.]
MPRQLLHITSWAHEFVAEVVGPGDFAVDLTAGKGSDALFLARKVAPGGRVLAFDIQEEALECSRRTLEQAAVPVHVWGEDDFPPVLPEGVSLVHDTHARLESYLHGAPRAVIANLGFLPGSESTVKTAEHSTCVALRQACLSLEVGGRIAVAVYVGHSGGREEGQALERVFGDLSSRKWHVLRLEVANRKEAPYLLVAEKRQ